VTITVRRGDATDIDAAAAVLADAFRDYPMLNWTVAADRHVERITGLQHLALKWLTIPYGECWLALDGDEVVAVAAWMPPGFEVPAAVADYMAPIRAELEGDRHEHSLAADLLMDHLKPTIPAYYLGTVGTLTLRQGEGIGRAVLAPVLDRLDGEHAAAYLETSTPTNVAFYRRLGFEVTAHATIPGGPETWVMLRQPN
jgi:GNAT superfamily N-acetyltransferase